jgi:hypothetical protein
MIRKIERRGERILVIDIRYKKKDGTKARYRKAAQVQTVPAAAGEEQVLRLEVAMDDARRAPLSSAYPYVGCCGQPGGESSQSS